ncbi:MAG TPA: hypothetical protein PLH67_04700, partial [Lentisphaeria bacterium]|nr:hypothetical protein [Lentisphaeria bacterium]
MIKNPAIKRTGIIFSLFFGGILFFSDSGIFHLAFFVSLPRSFLMCQSSVVPLQGTSFGARLSP